MAGVDDTRKLYLVNHSHYGCQASKKMWSQVLRGIFVQRFFLTYSLNSRGEFVATYLDGLVPLTFKNNSYRSIFIFALKFLVWYLPRMCIIHAPSSKRSV